MIMFIILAIFALLLLILFILQFMDDDGMFDGIRYMDIYEPKSGDKRGKYVINLIYFRNDKKYVRLYSIENRDFKELSVYELVKDYVKVE